MKIFIEYKGLVLVQVTSQPGAGKCPNKAMFQLRPRLAPADCQIGSHCHSHFHHWLPDWTRMEDWRNILPNNLKQFSTPKAKSDLNKILIKLGLWAYGLNSGLRIRMRRTHFHPWLVQFDFFMIRYCYPWIWWANLYLPLVLPPAPCPCHLDLRFWIIILRT